MQTPCNKFDAVNHDVAAQMKDLLVGPWQPSEAPELSPYLIVIDAFDEIMDNKGRVFLSKSTRDDKQICPERFQIFRHHEPVRC